MSTAKHDLKNSKRTGSKSSKRITNHPTKHHFFYWERLSLSNKTTPVYQHWGWISYKLLRLSRNILGFVWNDSIQTLWQLRCIGKHIPFPWHRWLKEWQESSWGHCISSEKQVSFPNFPSASLCCSGWIPRDRKATERKLHKNPSGKTMILLCFCHVLLPPDT